MGALTSIDGRIVPADEARISVFDRGFLYGDSVFEALRTYGGVPFALDEHIARLEASAGHALIDMPVSRERWHAEIAELLRAADNPESYLRLVLTRGTGAALGLDPALARAPTRVILAMPFEPPKPELYERGIGVVPFRTQRVADNTPASGAKLSNYLISVLALREAKENGAEEALVLDAAGRVIEGTTSNVFLVRGKTLVTPPADAGILVGITRGKVLELAAASGLTIDERAFWPSELTAADEAFITSSVRELVPVVRVGSEPVGAGRPGPVTLELLEELRALARGGRFPGAQS